MKLTKHQRNEKHDIKKEVLKVKHHICNIKAIEAVND